MSEHRSGNDIFTQQQASAAGIQTRNVLKDDFGFEVPVESVPLPSQGLIYPAGSSLYKSETVDIKSMTAKEEDILTSRALIKKGTVISHLLKSCIVDRNVDVESMISGDRNAVMIALRITGYGAGYNVEVSCPECGENNKQEFNLADLPIKRLEIQPVVDGANLFEFSLPVSKKKVLFRFLTGADETEISQETDRRKKKLGIETDSNVTLRLQTSIIEVDGIKDKNKISQFVRNMPAADSRALRKFMDENEPGVEMKSFMVCSSCGETSEVRLPLGASFFWPDA
jgi:hypothetical protein